MRVEGGFGGDGLEGGHGSGGCAVVALADKFYPDMFDVIVACEVAARN